jgi:hypothetical protein
VPNIAGLPGALIAAGVSDPRECRSAAGMIRFTVGVLVSAFGQSYVYLAFVASVVNFTKFYTQSEGVIGPVVWPVAFIAAFFPLYLCAGAGVGEAEAGYGFMERSSSCALIHRGAHGRRLFRVRVLPERGRALT